LEELFKGSVSDYEAWLAGGWVRTFTNQRNKPIRQILFFDPAARNLRLIESDRLESHNWPISHKPSYGTRLQAILVNENFRSQKTIASIIPTGVNNISFGLQDRDDWTGDFIRMTQEQEESWFSRASRAIPINRIILSGLYRSETGFEMVFSTPRFTWREGSTRRQGGYLTYQLNNSVLELKFISDKGLIEKTEVWIIKLDTIEQPGHRTRRILTMQPAALNINGVHATSNEIIRLEQSASDSPE